MRGSRFIRMAVAAAIVVAGVGLGSGTAGAEPVGGGGTVLLQESPSGSAIQYTCTGTDLDPQTVAVSIDTCELREAPTGPVIDSATATPVVVPGHAAATADVAFTGLTAGDTYYLCWTVTSIYELKPRQTTSGCREEIIEASR